MKIEVTPIAFARSCYKEKFATPRQPGLVNLAKGQIELVPPYNDQDTVDGLESCSHIWLQFVFHECLEQGWRPKVRPPRLGGNKKMGVFATRATHRPNGLGLSVVKLDGIEINKGNVIIHVSGLDLIDGTPILDIKPYIPYSDHVDAQYPFAQTAPVTTEVLFDLTASEKSNLSEEMQSLITQVLSQDPKPAFHKIDPTRIYGTHLEHYNVQWVYESLNENTIIKVIHVTPID